MVVVNCYGDHLNCPALSTGSLLNGEVEPKIPEFLFPAGYTKWSPLVNVPMHRPYQHLVEYAFETPLTLSATVRQPSNWLSTTFLQPTYFSYPQSITESNSSGQRLPANESVGDSLKGFGQKSNNISYMTYMLQVFFYPLILFGLFAIDQ
ncbi:hypothetical protein CROQUDRAFT_106161 [Cronartium quercuum f. sp. fusiforme G11]|uniref:Uncharacterized protein n=1 Tax=Cronartium quercuum f. sp. fusiforme G11 TaxID=708437 RepID=A0A9P6NLL2_9BASI|nr:hypothetical protein CROQUDRAFT_106161 [Cronartium quercuum f. sp. fusiforme G11]